MASPETKDIPKPSGDVKERQEDFVVSERIQDIAKPTQSQVTAKVTDDDDNDLIETPKTKQVNIELPDTQDKIEFWTKGSPSDSVTWLGFFWTRMIKKALHFGWRVFLGGGVSSNNKTTQQAQDDQGSDGEFNEKEN